MMSGGAELPRAQSWLLGGGSAVPDSIHVEAFGVKAQKVLKPGWREALRGCRDSLCLLLSGLTPSSSAAFSVKRALRTRRFSAERLH